MRTHSSEAKTGQNDVPINLNERQKWFLIKLESDKNTAAEHVAKQFSVTKKTAKRDIADLKAKHMIQFHGSRKTGYYEII